jgi:hypothetical protein
MQCPCSQAISMQRIGTVPPQRPPPVVADAALENAASVSAPNPFFLPRQALSQAGRAGCAQSEQKRLKAAVFCSFAVSSLQKQRGKSVR